MFSKPTKLFVIKFLGLFGGKSIQDRGDHVKDQTVTTGQRAQMHAQVLSSRSDIQEQCDDAIETSGRKIANFMLEKGVPGLTICVSRRSRIVWHSAFGLCDVENQMECKPEARMRIASISKSLFAATIIAPMLEQNKIDLNSSIHKYIGPDDFPRKQYNGKDVDITVEQLLSHTSGIRHYNEGRASDLPFRPIGSPGSLQICQCDEQFARRDFFQRKTYRNVTDALEPFKDEPLDSEPGKFQYTTYGYTLLSAVAERALHKAATTDEAKKEQIEDHWLKALRRDWGLNETSLDQDELLLPNRARYYLRTAFNGGLINAPYTDNSIKWAGGGISSTAKDLVIFGNALIDAYKQRGATKLKKETVDLMWTEREKSYGLGFEMKELDPSESGGERRAVYHLGGAMGASSALILYPEREVVVAILTNLGMVNLRAVGLKVADEFARCAK